MGRVFVEYNFEIIGPYKIGRENDIFQSPYANQCGIYIWAIKVKDKYIINYIFFTFFPFFFLLFILSNKHC